MPRQRITNLFLWLAPLAFLGLFYFYPMGSIMRLSFGRSEAFAAPFIQMAHSDSLKRILGFTFWQASLSTLLTLLIGLPGAYLLARFQFAGKSWLRALTTIPFVLPTLVVAAAFNAMLGPRGWVNLVLMSWLDLATPPVQFQYTFGAILVAHVFYNTTIVLRTVGDFWSRLDPHLGQAAQVLGAGRLSRLFQVTLPLLLPAILSASLLVFIFNFSSFGVILVLGGPQFATLEVEIYFQTINLFNLPLAAALSMLQLACTLALTIVYTRLSQRVSQPLNLRPAHLTQRRLGSWKSRLLAGALVTFYALLFIAPLASLATRSLIQVEPAAGNRLHQTARFTFDYYRELSVNRRAAFFFVPPTTAIGFSLAYALSTALLALTLGLPAAWALARDPQSRLNRLIDPLLMLPLGTSAITLGLGFIVALASPPLNLRAAPVLIPLAHTLVAFPFVVRSLTPALRSIRPRLRQAAAVLGASPRQTLWQIDLPLVGRAVLVAAAFAFTISLGEFGATALVTRPEYPTIPVVIYRFLSQPGALNYGQALALSTILSVITGAAILAIERLRIAEIGEF